MAVKELFKPAVFDEKKPMRLSFVFLHRMYKYNKMSEKAEKLLTKKPLNQDKFERICDKRDKCANKLTSFNKLQSFVVKQVEVNELNFVQRLVRHLKSARAFAGAVILGFTGSAVVFGAGLSVYSHLFLQSAPAMIGSAVAGLILLSAAGGLAAAKWVANARAMLEVGKEKALALATKLGAPVFDSWKPSE